MSDLTIISAARKALRVSTHVFDDEISDLIDAAKNDLITGGVVLTAETDPLIRQAIKYYCRANFQNSGSAERELNDKCYQRLKAQLGASGMYNTDETGGGDP